MSYIEAIVLGVIQGLTEFLPVSSSGHLALGHLLFNAEGGGRAFDILLHGATLLVILGAFWRSFVSLLREQRRQVWLLMWALVPTGIVGLLWRDQMGAIGSSPWGLAACFAVTGAFLWAVGIRTSEEGKSSQEASKTEDFGKVGFARALAVGLAQALALAPGVSRSGLTISAGRLCGLTPDMAVSFSFVMGAPTIVAAIVVEAHPIRDLVFADPGPLVVGFISALISGWAAMGMLKWVARRGTLPRFAPYCFLLCAICLALGAAGR